jgi:hypothetical protein
MKNNHPRKQPKGGFRARIERHLNRITERHIAHYIDTYATDDQGNQDPDTARLIRREVTRRSVMGRELDIFEPFRWTLASFALSSLAAIGLKVATGEHVNLNTGKTILTTTALSSGINLMRLDSRFKAGLQGGLDTALAMRELERRYPLTQGNATLRAR